MEPEDIIFIFRRILHSELKTKLLFFSKIFVNTILETFFGQGGSYRAAFLACYWLFFLALTPCAKPIQIMRLSQIHTNEVLYINSQKLSSSAMEDSAPSTLFLIHTKQSVLKSLMGLCMKHKQKNTRFRSHNKSGNGNLYGFPQPKIRF